MNMLVSTLRFKQPLIDPEDQYVVHKEDYIALLQIKVQSTQSSFRPKNDVVDWLLVCFIWMHISCELNQEFLPLDMLVVHLYRSH